MKSLLSVILTIFLSLNISYGAPRKDFPKVEWDLSTVYKNKKEWERALTAVEKDLGPLKKCKGKLMKSASRLESCLTKMYTTGLTLSKIWTWAGLQSATDSLNPGPTEMVGKVRMLYSNYSQAISFFDPEIAAAGEKKINKYLKKNKKLEPYSQYLRDISLQAKHILTAEQEKIISAFSPVVRGSSGAVRFLQNADIEWPKVKLSTGEEVVIDIAGYTKHRQSSNRADRKKVFDAFYKILRQYERTFGSTLANSVQSRTIEAKLRKHENALAQALGRNQIPQEIYRTLVSEVNNSLPTLHRYFKIRKAMLGLKKQEYIDIYPSVVESNKEYTLDKSRDLLISAVAPLGDDYVKKIKYATKQQWMDVYPRKGKVSGAFMSGSIYRHNPYVLLNHQNDYTSATTYAHEWGHALHTIYSDENQPAAKARYTIFVAEIAAIVNEALMLEKILKDTKDEQEKLYYLGHALEFIRGTYFRQTQFSEFELKLHEEIEKGNSLSGQKISQIYGDIVRRYYGHDKGVVNIDEKFFTEWAFVGHFYSGFYVYQYSTSIAAAYHFAEKILNGDKKTLEKYMNVLKAGGSKYPHEILMDAGLDMTKPDAYKAIDRKANLIMDEMETILKKQGRFPLS